MPNLSLQWIAELYNVEAKKIDVSRYIPIIETINWKEIKMYDEETIKEIGKKLFGRDIEEVVELSEFNKNLKKMLALFLLFLFYS